MEKEMGSLGRALECEDACLEVLTYLVFLLSPSGGTSVPSAPQPPVCTPYSGGHPAGSNIHSAFAPCHEALPALQMTLQHRVCWHPAVGTGGEALLA